MPTEYVVKVTLVDSKPAIWRRLRVPGEVTLAQLHDALQAAFGWTNSHLHEFLDAEDKRYGVPHPDFDLELLNEEEATLAGVCPEERSEILYTYDMGDSWEHLIRVEKIDPDADEPRSPACLAGAGNGPPEDCGGVWGYANLIEVLANPTHPEYEELAEWIGGSYDAEHFDLNETNSRLKRAL